MLTSLLMIHCKIKVWLLDLLLLVRLWPWEIESFGCITISNFCLFFPHFYINSYIFVFFVFVLTDKLTSNAALDPEGLVAIAICHGFALFVAVAVGANISGGHVNPAVTFGLALGGQITVLTGIFYWIAQLLGSIVACFLLKAVTGGLVSFVW